MSINNYTPISMKFMKRALLAIVGLVSAFQASAQIGAALTINLERSVEEAPCTGDVVCINVTAEDFTDIVALQSFFTWNPAVLAFKEIVPGNLSNLSNADFNFTDQNSGSIFLDWQGIPCGSSSGLTLADGTVLFQLCFTAQGSYGAATTITMPVTDFPNAVNYPRALKNNTCSANINVGVATNGVTIATCVNPVQIIASQEQAQQGDLVCVDYSVNGFENIASAQFSVNWDSDLLAFENLIIPTAVQNQIGLQTSDFGLPDQPNVGPGNLTLSWFLLSGDPNYIGKSLDDGTVMFQACYRITAECETSADIIFSDNPTIVEFSNFRTDTLAPDGSRVNFIFPEGTFEFTPGGVTVGACEPTGLNMTVNCADPVNIGDVICIPISSSNFNNIFEMRYLLDWNPEILEFQEVTNLNTTLQLNASHFDASNAANGVLGVNWKSTNTPKNTTDILYEVCFKVVGFGGNSPISFKGSPTMVARETNNGTNIGIAPKNCTVEVNVPAEVGISIGSGSARTGEQVCLDVSVSNFNRMIDFGFSLGWDANEIGFRGIENINLPGATLADNFDVSGVDGGILGLNWTSETGVTLDPDEVIFQICFEILGGPAEECIDVLVLDQIIPPVTISETSGGNNLGVIKQDGQACILFPEGFYMSVGSAEGYVLDTVCVDFEVSYFDNMSRADFTVEWDPTALFYVGAQGSPVVEENSTFTFDDNSAFTGLLNVNWESNNLAPWSFGVDSVLFFEACFVVLGPARDCYPISISETPTPNVVTANGTGSLVSDPGEICAKDTILIIEELITAASCPDSRDGSVELVLSGGQSPVGVLWKTVPEQFGPVARNLSPGTVDVVIFDNANPSIVINKTIEIGSSAPVPVVEIGEDQILGCNAPGVLLDATVSVGPEYIYQWSKLNVPLEGGSSSSYVATSPGVYVLSVLNSQIGCQSRDTVQVLAEALPVANAGTDRAITCDVSTAQLQANTSQGDAVSYSWSSPDGGMVTPGQENLPNPIVTAIGTYVLEVSFNESGCSETDTVRVLDRTIPPVIVAADATLSCGGEPRTITASFEIPGQPASFLWTSLDGDTLSLTNILTVSEVGQYIVIGTDEFTGCSASDTVSVGPGNDFPTVNAGEDMNFSCANDSLVVTAQTDATNYSVAWRSLQAGGIIANGREDLRLVVAAPGVYEITLTDLDKFCFAQDTVVINDLRELPTIALADSATLDCTTQSVILDASGSSSGPEFTNTWRKDGVVIGENTLNIGVNEVGFYAFTVTNNTTGCSASQGISVGNNPNTPMVTIAEPSFILGCAYDTLTLTASVLDDLTNYTVEWRTNNGSFATPTNTLSVAVDKGALYQVLIKDEDSGCVGSATYEVQEDYTAPVADAGVDKFIGCNTDTVLLGGNSSQGVAFRYAWVAVQDGGPAMPPFDDSTMVSLPGIYELTVTDTRNGCTATDQVEVIANVAIPSIVLNEPGLLTCENDIITLDASGSDAGTDFTAEWRGLDFNDLTIKETGNPLVINVVEEGFYELTLTNNATGCFSQETIFVDADIEAPQVIFDATQEFNCLGEEAVISAKRSFLPSQFTPVWSAVDPGNTVVPTDSSDLVAVVDGPGQYVLTLTLERNGCSATDTITVSSDPQTPVADAGDINSIDCGATLTLDASGSSMGDVFVYEWKVVEGSGTISNDTTLMPTVTEAGLYQLIVKNIENGCTDTAELEVTVNTANLPLAMAGEDLQVCEDGATLNAELPANTFGTWTTSGTASIDSPADPVTFASNLSAGENVFVWSLSQVGCENYSADSVVILLAGAPQAVNDSYKLPYGTPSININLSSNDQFDGLGAFSIELLSSPSIGELVEFNNGSGIYAAKPGLSGVDTFSYSICSLACPDNCSEALVEITVEAAEIPNISRDSMPNGITPNGDGRNDAFVFDLLLNGTADYPDNEMIIFNRWGDIVYQARPYLNDWQGTNNSGKDLPTGTYYYILRLDLANGKILRGDVTIIR